MHSKSDSPKKYWAFISYSSKDANWGKWLHRRLEGFTIPKESRGNDSGAGSLGSNLRPVFRDRDELSGSSELGSALQAALRESRNLVVLCSPNSAQSEWVNREIEDFRAMGGDGRIFALILDGEPNATSSQGVDPGLECFPPALRYPAEPLAGDLRKSGDGKERGFLKVVSGITGIGFAELFRRHEREKRKRQLIFSALSAAIIIALSGLTFYAFAKERQAVKARKASDDLVAFMVNDLYEQLRKTGRLNALGSAVGQIEEHQRTNPTSPENRLRTGLNQVSILFETGHPAQATILAEKMISSAENKPGLRNLVARLQLSMADYLAWNPDKLGEALDYAQKAAAYFRASREDGSSEELVRALNYKGDALRDLGRLDEAAEAYREAVGELSGSGNAASHIGIRTHDRLGEVLEMQGKPAEAQEQYREAYELSDEGTRQSPEDLEWRCDKALALSRLQPKDGGNPVAEAEKLLSELLRIEFSNARWRLELAKIKGLLAESDDPALSLEDRAALAGESIGLIKSLTNDNPKQPVWQRELVNALNRKGHALNDPSAHREAMQVALSHSHDPVMVELALTSIIFQMWATGDEAAQQKLAGKFDSTWNLLSENQRERPQCQNLRFQSLVERLRLMETESTPAKSIREECEGIIAALSENGTSPEIIGHLRDQLENPE